MLKCSPNHRLKEDRYEAIVICVSGDMTDAERDKCGRAVHLHVVFYPFLSFLEKKDKEREAVAADGGGDKVHVGVEGALDECVCLMAWVDRGGGAFFLSGREC